ncbi:hypothetical protein ACHAW6_002928 [Cyclotella cf. meneghiniana]
MSVDCVNKLIEELRIQPSTKWFDPKSKSSGFKHKYAMPLNLKWQTCIWSNGPYPPGDVGVAHDGCLFCSGTLDQPKSLWNKNCLYHKIPPGK